MTHFQVCVGHFFLFQTHLATDSYTVKMPPHQCKKPVYITDRTLTEEAKAEVSLLRHKIYRSSETLEPAEFDRVSRRLSHSLQLLRYCKADTSRL